MISARREDFAPSPMRWRGTLQITVVSMLTVAAAMILRVPEAALGCYLVFFAWRDDVVSSVMIAIALSIMPVLVVFLALPLLRLSADSSFWRLIMVCSITFVGMTVAHASRVAPILGTLSFVFVFSITLYDIVPDPDLLTRGMTWLMVTTFLPMLMTALVALFVSLSPKDRALEILTDRQKACDAKDMDALAELVDDGNAPLLGYIGKAKLIRHVSKEEAERLEARAQQSLMQCMRVYAGLEPRLGPPAPPLEPFKEDFFSSGPFTDVAHMRFGAKVALSVLITYFIYTVSGLFEIHTAMITCFFVALGTGAETRHKITLRVIGATLGAILGIAVVFGVMPHVDDIGQLMVLVAFGAFPAAWISLGSERISYMGWQMALCYFLVILNGFGPALDPIVALHRLVGIALGIGVVWVVFAVFWPVRAEDKITRCLETFDTRMARTAGHSLSATAVDWLNVPLAEADRVADYLRYEGQSDVWARDQIALARARLNRKLTHATGELYV